MSLTQERAAQARAAIEGMNGNGPAENTLRSLSLPELRELPPVAWLIDKLLVALAFVVLYGPSGVGKSFLALDLALTVASGEPWWIDRQTAGGWVLYLAAEGAAGLAKRVDAWCEAHGIPEPERIRFMPDAVNLLDRATVAHVIERIGEMPEPPALLVIDTMARTMVGGDENSARDVGQFIAAVDQLRAAASNCTALVVHHTGKRGDDERGSSALRGASDQMLSLSEGGGGLVLAFDKLKDFDPPRSLHLHLATWTHDDGREMAAIQLGSREGSLTPSERRLLERLSELDGSDQPSVTRLAELCSMSPRTYHRVLASLRHKGYLAKEQHGKAVWNHLTSTGREALER